MALRSDALMRLSIEMRSAVAALVSSLLLWALTVDGPGECLRAF